MSESKNLVLVSTSETHDTFTCVTKTTVANEDVQCNTQFTHYKDLDTMRELLTQQDSDDLREIRKIRAQDADRRIMKENDPKKIILRQAKAKLSKMSDDELIAFAKQNELT